MKSRRQLEERGREMRCEEGYGLVETAFEERVEVSRTWNVSPAFWEAPCLGRKFLMRAGHSCLHCPFYADSAVGECQRVVREYGRYHFHLETIHDGTRECRSVRPSNRDSSWLRLTITHTHTTLSTTTISFSQRQRAGDGRGATPPVGSWRLVGW